MPRELLVLPYQTSLTPRELEAIANGSAEKFRGAYSSVRILPARTTTETELAFFSGLLYTWDILENTPASRLSGEKLTENLHKEFGSQHVLVYTDLATVSIEADRKQNMSGKAVSERLMDENPRGKAYVSPRIQAIDKNELCLTSSLCLKSH